MAQYELRSKVLFSIDGEKLHIQEADGDHVSFWISEWNGLDTFVRQQAESLGIELEATDSPPCGKAVRDMDMKDIVHNVKWCTEDNPCELCQIKQLEAQLAEVTRQRDVAVEALGECSGSWDAQEIATQALAEIKEAEHDKS